MANDVGKIYGGGARGQMLIAGLFHVLGFILTFMGGYGLSGFFIPDDFLLVRGVFALVVAAVVEVIKVSNISSVTKQVAVGGYGGPNKVMFRTSILLLIVAVSLDIFVSNEGRKYMLEYAFVDIPRPNRDSVDVLMQMEVDSVVGMFATEIKAMENDAKAIGDNSDEMVKYAIASEEKKIKYYTDMYNSDKETYAYVVPVHIAPAQDRLKELNNNSGNKKVDATTYVVGRRKELLDAQMAEVVVTKDKWAGKYNLMISDWQAAMQSQNGNRSVWSYLVFAIIFISTFGIILSNWFLHYYLHSTGQDIGGSKYVRKDRLGRITTAIGDKVDAWVEDVVVVIENGGGIDFMPSKRGVMLYLGLFSVVVAAYNLSPISLGIGNVILIVFGAHILYFALASKGVGYKVSNAKMAGPKEDIKMEEIPVFTDDLDISLNTEEMAAKYEISIPTSYEWSDNSFNKFVSSVHYAARQSKEAKTKDTRDKNKGKLRVMTQMLESNGFSCVVKKKGVEINKKIS